MCDICHHSPCLHGCPNEPDAEAVYTCSFCGEDIVEGDEYVEFDHEYYHENCFDDAAPNILIDNEDASIHHAHDGANNRAIIGKCSHCEEEIYADEDYASCEEKLYHYECFMDVASMILRKKESLSTQTAEKYECGPDDEPFDF